MKLALAIAVTMLCGCSTTNWDRQHLLGPTPVADLSVPVIGEYREALAAVKKAPHDQGLIADYVDAGVNVTDAACLAWFDRVTAAERGLNLSNDGLAVINALVTTVMGIANANQVIVSSMGAAMTAYSGFSQAFNSALLTAPSTYAIQAKLLEIMDGASTQIRNDPGRTLAQASGKLMRYARLCSFGTMQAAGNDALRNTETIANPSSGALRTLPRGALETAAPAPLGPSISVERAPNGSCSRVERDGLGRPRATWSLPQCPPELRP